MPTHNENINAVFQLSRNRTTGDYKTQGDKMFGTSYALTHGTRASSPSKVTSPSSSTNTADVRWLRSPSMEHSVLGQSGIDRDIYCTTLVPQSNLWISPDVSEDTSSYRSSSSESTLASEVHHAASKVDRGAIDDESSFSLTESSIDMRAPRSSLTGHFCVTATPDSLIVRSTSSDPLGLFSHSDSLTSLSSSSSAETSTQKALDFSSTPDEISITMTSSQRSSVAHYSSIDNHNAGHDVSSNSPLHKLPGAAAHSLHSSSGDDTEVEEPRPTKRRRRGLTDSSLPPSDLILSPSITGSSYAPFLPITSSPHLLSPTQEQSPDASIGVDTSEIKKDVADAAPHSRRRVSGRVSKPSDRHAPRPWASSSSSVPLTATTRRSTRNPQYLPLGPRHLEYDYHVAHAELREATIRAAQALQYPFPTRKTRALPGKFGGIETSEDLVSPTLAMILEAQFPYVEKARRKVNDADRHLQEALSRGETWQNTSVPESILAITYEDVQASMPPPLKPQSFTRATSRGSFQPAAPSPQPRLKNSVPESVALGIRPAPGSNKNLTPHQRATLAYKPKEITGKRRQIVLSLQATPHETPSNS